MELKVWVEGMPRIVCGVTDVTTCQDVVVTLAHATGKTGRFTLIEKWRDNEHMLAPTENPLNALQKWGEYANDVQLILRHSLGARGQARSMRNHSGRYLHAFTPPPCHNRRSGIKKALTFSGAHSRTSLLSKGELCRDRCQENSSLDSLEDGCSSVTSHSSSGTSSCASFNAHKRAQLALFPASPFVSLEDKLATAHSPDSSSLSSSSSKTTSPCEDRHKVAPPAQHCVRSCKSQNGNEYQNSSENKNTAVPKIDGSIGQGNTSSSRTVIRVNVNGSALGDGTQSGSSTAVSKDELVRLIAKNEERLKVQHSQVSAVDSEITVWEEHEHEFKVKSEVVTAAMSRLELTEREMGGELGELELVRWEEKLQMEQRRNECTQSELATAPSKLQRCDSELVKHRDNIHRLRDDVEVARKKRNLEDEAKRDADLYVIHQIAELQKQLNVKLSEHEVARTSNVEDVGEMAKLESAISARASLLETLENQLKDVNMKLFSHTANDVTTDGCSKGSSFRRASPNRPRSARKLTLPLLLKETIATARNPHGLWV